MLGDSTGTDPSGAVDMEAMGPAVQTILTYLTTFFVLVFTYLTFLYPGRTAHHDPTDSLRLSLLLWTLIGALVALGLRDDDLVLAAVPPLRRAILWLLDPNVPYRPAYWLAMLSMFVPLAPVAFSSSSSPWPTASGCSSGRCRSPRCFHFSP